MYVAYRLVKGSEGHSDIRPDTDSSLSLSEDDEKLENDSEVLEELEDTQLNRRLETLEQDNQKLKEEVAKLEHGRTWLEERVDVLENMMKNKTFSQFDDQIPRKP